MRAAPVFLVLSVLGCGAKSGSEPAAGACAGGPAAWDQEHAVPENVYASGLSVASDPISKDILAVSLGSDSELSRMTSAGHELWRRARPLVGQVAFGKHGDAFVSGSFTGSLTLDGVVLDANGSNAGFVARLDADGTVVWAKSVSADGGGLSVTALASDADGSSVALFQYGFTLPNSSPNPIHKEGFLVVRLDSSGNELWRKHVWDLSTYVVATSLALDAAGDIAISGSVNEGSIDLGNGAIPSSADARSFVAKLGADGQLRWSRALPGALTYAQSVAFSSEGKLYVAGWIGDDGAQYTSQPFLTELDAAGALGATASFQSGDQNDGIRVAARACGGALVVTNSYLSGTRSAVIFQLAGANAAPSTHPIAPPELVTGVAEDGHGGLFLTGARPVSPPSKVFVSHWRP